MHLSSGNLHRAEENDWELQEGQSMLKWMAAKSPDVSRIYEYSDPDVWGMGGPVFLELGERITISATDHDPKSSTFNTNIEKKIDVVFKDSSL